MMGGAERRLKKEATLNETIGCPRCTYCAAYLQLGPQARKVFIART